MIIFIHGEDTFRSREKLRSVIFDFKKKRDPQGYNIVRLDGSTLSVDRFRHEVQAQGFLAVKRMIVVERLLSRGTAEIADNIAEFIATQPLLLGKEGNVVIFWEEDEGAKIGTMQGNVRKSRAKSVKSKRANGGGKLRDFLFAQEYKFTHPLFDTIGTKSWISARAHELGAEIAPAAVDCLVGSVGADIWRLDRELTKLAALRQGSIIAMEDVQITGAIKEDQAGFAFTDAVVARDMPQSLRELVMLAGTGIEPLIIHGMLVRLFRTLSLVKSYQEDTGARDTIAAAQDLGVHPYVVKKLLPQVREFGWDDIREIYRRLLILDLNLKRQVDDPYLPLELFVINLTTCITSPSVR